MLRELKNNHLAPFLVGFDVTTPSTVNFGTADLVPSTITTGGVGRMNFNLRDPFRRVVGLASPYQSVADGAIARFDPTLGLNMGIGLTDNAAPSFANGRAVGLFLGWRNPQTDVTMAQLVQGLGFSAPRIMGGRFNTDGSVLQGAGDFTCVRTATGAYTVTFRNAFGRPPIVIPTVGTATQYANIVAVAANQVTITTWDATPSAADSVFHLLVYGGQGRDEVGRSPKPILNTQRAPRILGYRVDWSAGTPAYNIGGEDATGVPLDNATGDVTITFKTPFRKVPYVGLTANTAGLAASIVSVTATSLRALVYDQAGTAQDDRLYAVVLGSDDPSEY